MPRWYRRACICMPYLGWMPIVFLPPVIHGGTLTGEIVAWSGVALGGYGALEVARSAGRSAVHAIAWFGVALYGAALALGLYGAIYWLAVYP